MWHSDIMLHSELIGVVTYTDYCGRKRTQPVVQRVSVGNRTENWPWMASIGFFDQNGNWRHQCGGTVVDDRHILTAAHCLLEGKL